MVNWERGRKLIEPAVAEWSKRHFHELPALEERVKKLVSDGKNEEAKKAVTEYIELICPRSHEQVAGDEKSSCGECSEATSDFNAAKAEHISGRVVNVKRFT